MQNRRQDGDKPVTRAEFTVLQNSVAVLDRKVDGLDEKLDTTCEGVARVEGNIETMLSMIRRRY